VPNDLLKVVSLLDFLLEVFVVKTQLAQFRLRAAPLINVSEDKCEQLAVVHFEL
jgi:hypothetical protein